MWPAGQPMYFNKEYTQPSEDSEKPDKIKRIYNNYDACKDCIHRESCLSKKQSQKTAED